MIVLKNSAIISVLRASIRIMAEGKTLSSFQHVLTAFIF